MKGGSAEDPEDSAMKQDVGGSLYRYARGHPGGSFVGRGS
jgi:hypothetical protein